jgi:hypothetical protein
LIERYGRPACSRARFILRLGGRIAYWTARPLGRRREQLRRLKEPRGDGRARAIRRTLTRLTLEGSEALPVMHVRQARVSR